MKKMVIKYTKIYFVGAQRPSHKRKLHYVNDIGN